MLNSSDLERYKKQILIDDIGENGQELIKNAKVLVVGAGGLGSPIIMYLAAAGIGGIGIADFDEVSLSNLNRQVLYKESDMEKSKAKLAGQWVNLFSSNTKVNIYNKKLSDNNTSDIMKDYDIVVSAVDNMDTRFLINKFAHKMGKAWVDGGVSQWFGYAGIYVNGQGCLNCHKGSSYDTNEKGVIGAVCGIIGLLEVQLTLNYILKKEEQSKIVIYDAKNMELNKAEIEKDENCELCRK